MSSGVLLVLLVLFLVFGGFPIYRWDRESAESPPGSSPGDRIRLSAVGWLFLACVLLNGCFAFMVVMERFE